MSDLVTTMHAECRNPEDPALLWHRVSGASIQLGEKTSFERALDYQRAQIKVWLQRDREHPQIGIKYEYRVALETKATATTIIEHHDPANERTD